MRPSCRCHHRNVTAVTKFSLRLCSNSLSGAGSNVHDGALGLWEPRAAALLRSACVLERSSQQSRQPLTKATAEALAVPTPRAFGRHLAKPLRRYGLGLGLFGGRLSRRWRRSRRVQLAIEPYVFGLEGDISAADIGISEMVVVLWCCSQCLGINRLDRHRSQACRCARPTTPLDLRHGWSCHRRRGSSGQCQRFLGFGQLSARESTTETGLVFGVGVESNLTETMSALGV